MKKFLGAAGVLILLLVGAIVATGQVPDTGTGVFRTPVQVLTGYLYLARNVTIQGEGTTNDAIELTVRVPDPDFDWTFTFPPNPGSNGQQLTTNGSGVTSWSAASSQRANKNIDGRIDPCAARDAILRTPIYRFHYKRDGSITTGDYATEYVGLMADEAPWAMHYNGTILNPVNTAGYAMAAAQCQQAEIEALRAEIRHLKE